MWYDHPLIKLNTNLILTGVVFCTYTWEEIVSLLLYILFAGIGE
jgi:hypothetical protein